MAGSYQQFNIPAVNHTELDVNSWYGLNRKSGLQKNGEMKEMKNMGKGEFPFASPRGAREIIAEKIVNPQKIFFASGELGYIGNGVLYHGKKREGDEVQTDTNGFIKKGEFGIPKCIVDMNKNIIGFPNNTFYDYSENADIEEMISGVDKESSLVLPEYYNEDVNYFTYKANKIRYGYIQIEQYFDMPYETVEGKKVAYLKPSVVAEGTEYELKYFVDFYNSSKEWLGFYSFDNNIYFGEAIDDNTDEADIAAFFTLKVNVTKDYNYTSHTVHGDFYNKATEENPAVKIYVYNKTYPIEGSIPQMTDACVDNNRIIGVHKNDIYVSALGNFKDFTTFADVEGSPNPVGSYATSVDGGGEFTTAFFYNGYTVLAKKDNLYIMAGNMPPYRISSVAKIGCVDSRSVCEVHNILYFAGRKGIYAFSGGSPRLISKSIAIEHIEEAIGGTDGNAYYVCIDKKLYVYYPQENLWYFEDEIDIIDFAAQNGKLYALTADGTILCFNSGKEKVSWYFSTPEYNFKCAETKNIRRLYIRADVPENCTCTVMVSKDNGEYIPFAYLNDCGERIYDFKMRLGRCDSFSLAFCGEGNVKIMDIHCTASIGRRRHMSGSVIKTGN